MPESFAVSPDAKRSWHALVKPYYHRGNANWLSPRSPPPFFECDNSTSPHQIIVAVTTAGFVINENFQIDRLVNFYDQLDQVRQWMDRHAQSLLFQQLLICPWTQLDGMTLSLWQSEASMKAFAYQSEIHKKNIKAFCEGHSAGRTSFIRFDIVNSKGSWLLSGETV